MALSNGIKRCDIFNSIDRLDEVRTVRELVKALKPILNVLAHDSVTGESSVLAYQEEWRSQYTNELYHEAGVDAAAAAPAPAPPGGPRGQPRQTSAAVTRPAQTNVPKSLQSILDGTHASFRD